MQELTTIGENLMKNINKTANIKLGMRNMKTAIAATFCAFIYLLLDRNPTFACIGAVFGLGGNMEESKLNGGNRLFGTIFGGLLGMLLFTLYIKIHPEGGFKPLMLLLLFVGVILLILISLYFSWPGAIQPGGVMLCIMLFNQPVDTYIEYSFNRIFDTAIGVIIALLINYFFPRERVVRWREAIYKKFSKKEK